MGKYTSDHHVTVKDSSGRVMNEYTAKDQIDFVKTGSTALQPVVIVLLCVTLLLAVLPATLLLLILIRSFKITKLLTYCPENKTVLEKFGYHSTNQLKRKSQIRLVIIAILGLPATATVQYLIFTANFAAFEPLVYAIQETLFNLANIIGVTYYGFDYNYHFVYDFRVDKNFINRLFDVYSEIWALVALIPCLLGALFYSKEKAIVELSGFKPHLVVKLITLPYVALHSLFTLPFRALGIAKPALWRNKD